MSLAGHALAVSSSSDDITYSEIDGINDLSFGPALDLLETTDFKDTTAARTRLAGLYDGTITMSGDYEAADTGMTNLRTLFGTGAACWIKILWDGSAGHKVDCRVESYEISASFDGKVEFSASLQFNAKPTAV